MRTSCARLAAVRGLRAFSSFAEAADSSATRSEIFSGTSSRRAGSIRWGVSFMTLADSVPWQYIEYHTEFWLIGNVWPVFWPIFVVSSGLRLAEVQ